MPERSRATNTGGAGRARVDRTSGWSGASIDAARTGRPRRPPIRRGSAEGRFPRSAVVDTFVAEPHPEDRLASDAMSDEPTPHPAQGALPLPEGGGALDRALALVRLLRERCPWDREQTPLTLLPHLLEEAHEVADAVRDGNPDGLQGELGDLLLNLAFQVVLLEEAGTGDAEAVYRRLEEKMVRRHPHLFAGAEQPDWEALKAAERPAGRGVLEGLASGLDPLTRAHRMQERVAGVGFDWEDHRGAYDKVGEELEEVREALESGAIEAVEEELGDLLFAVVNLVRLAGAHPSTALDRANRKFQARFERLEALAEERGIRLGEASLEELDRLWEELKGS